MARSRRAVLPFLHSPANGFDAFLAICGLLDAAVRSVEKGQGLAVYVVNATNSMRYLRLLRFLRLCGGLRLLMKACQSFLQSLLWSMLLLTTFLVASALFIGNLLQSFIEDRSQVLEDRLWVWEHFGTAYRSCYSLFEITFAGNWPVIARPVMNKVSHGFVAFFVLYITVIAFALIRIITAVFLKELVSGGRVPPRGRRGKGGGEDTLDMAANDAELLMSEKMKKKALKEDQTGAQYASKLEQVFLTIDSTGEGIITERRLAEVLEDPTMKTYFQTLDLDVHESNALFHLLDDGDGTVTLDEFIDGVMRCKGHAEIKQLDRKLSRLLHGQGAPGSGIASAASGPRGRGFSDPEMAPSNQSSWRLGPGFRPSRRFACAGGRRFGPEVCQEPADPMGFSDFGLIRLGPEVSGQCLTQDRALHVLIEDRLLRWGFTNKGRSLVHTETSMRLGLLLVCVLDAARKAANLEARCLDADGSKADKVGSKVLPGLFGCTEASPMQELAELEWTFRNGHLRFANLCVPGVNGTQQTFAACGNFLEPKGPFEVYDKKAHAGRELPGHGAESQLPGVIDVRENCLRAREGKMARSDDEGRFRIRRFLVVGRVVLWSWAWEGLGS
ncbi:unnamed protein product [Effrenium voratum]|nr:unnamed protein product [Effrenium voratum]